MSMQVINQNTKQQNSERVITVGAVYRHYSGKEYKVLAIARDSEDPTIMHVLYQGLYDCPTFGKNPIWVRPYTMFAQTVTINGAEQYRFTEINV